MKKLTLKLDDLEVTSFAAQDKQDQTGTVNGLQVSQEYHLTGCLKCNDSSVETQCLCTREAGCYPSKYCSGDGCVITHEEGCVTNNFEYC
jgi:hypothetical protein